MIQIETRRDRQQQRAAALQASAPRKAGSNKGHGLDKKLISWAFYAVLLALLTVIGALFQEVAFGQVVILLYGCIAIILRRDSSEMFKMALVALACIVVLMLVGNDDLAKAFATYTFLLLAFGVVGECIELIRVKRRKEGL